MTVATVFYILMLIAKILSQSTQLSQEMEKGWLDGGEIWNMCRRGYKASRRAEQTVGNIWSYATNISSAELRKQAPGRAQNPLAGLHFC